MVRTITIKHNHAYHRNKHLGYIVSDIRELFGLYDDSKYTVTITEGTQFEFKPPFFNLRYCLYKNGKAVGVICRYQFSKLFFEPDYKKKYDITVKRIKKGS